MGIDKAEITQLTLKNVGVHIEEQREAAENAVQQHLGASLALKDQCKQLLEIIGAADNAVKVPNREDSIPDLETLALIKTWLMKCVYSTESARRHQSNLVLTAQGALQQLNGVHTWVAKQFKQSRDVAARKAEDSETALKLVESDPDVVLDEDGDPVYVGEGACPAGVRPGNRAERRSHAAALEISEARARDVDVSVIPPTPVVRRQQVLPGSAHADT